MELSKEQAFQNVIAILKRYQGYTLDESEAIKHSLQVLDKIINPKVEEAKVDG